MNLAKLREPFAAGEIEWRIGQAGKSNGKPWARVLAYVTNRAIMDRLDEVCGPENWQNEYRPGPEGGIVCGISIRVKDGWVTKWDGAENTEIEGVKGGLSGAMKRAAVQWGIGRYLYDLPEGWAKIHDSGQHRARLSKNDGGDPYRWDPPDLPPWALPKQRTREDVLADRVRDVAIEVDTERERTGADPEKRPAAAELEEWFQAVERNADEMKRMGNRLGQERDRLKGLPGKTSYETFQAPALDDGELSL